MSDSAAPAPPSERRGRAVGIVVQNEYPHDAEVRPRKMARSLADAGYRVVVLAENGSGRPGREVLAPGITVRRYPPPDGWLPGRFLSKGHPWNLAWIGWIGRAVARDDLDLLICGNIGLGLQTGLAGKLRSVPVILDLFENNPGAVAARGKDRWFHHVTRNRRLVQLVEHWSARLADRTWVVAEENAERLLRQGIEGERIALVGNTPDALPADGDRRRMDGPFRMVYVGVLYRFRGLDLILEALPHLVATDPDVEVVIGGDGPHRPELERKARRLGVEDHVRFLGWVPAEDVPATIADCHLGLIPHRRSEHTETTIPNKLFDYMSTGIPVASTPLTPVVRILSRWECGIVLPDDDPRGAARALRELKGDAERTRILGRNGRRAVETRFNWRVEEHAVLQQVGRLASAGDRDAAEEPAPPPRFPGRPRPSTAR